MSHSSHSDTNELDTVFEPKKWIGKGIDYLKAPIHVILARETQERIPAAFQTFYPSSSLSIASFLRFSLPRSSFSLSSYSSENWFSKDPPTNLSCSELWKLLHTRSLPTRVELERLFRDFGQLWLDGAQSLCDPCINAGKDHLPLWFLTVWWEMVNLVEVQTGLKKAQEAAEKLVVEDEAVKAKFPTVDSIFRDIGWNETFDHGGVKVPAHEFAPLLRQVMLGKEVTQGMIAHLQDRLCQDPVASNQHYICGSEFSNFITTASERGKLTVSTKNPSRMKARCLQDIGEAVKSNPALQVWIPVLREQHQVVMKINFELKLIGYGKKI